ncbi:HPr kinase/phosphorylase [Paracoccus sp. (in: a-proteobacteria)]|uniref:HPr kinase/phosphorylase n=1 Tax=Paracoccus sp. TaxID=267 RepID=UPI003A89C7C3
MKQVHGTAVSVNGRGLLILGPSGSGKSSLALELMAAGGSLVSDDRTDLEKQGEVVMASAPQGLAGRIEARGVGILRVENGPPAAIRLVVDLGQREELRLPFRHHHNLIGVWVPLVLGPYRPQLYAALRQYLLAGRND